MPLEIDLIAGGVVFVGSEEVIPADFVQSCSAGVCGNVTTDSGVSTIGANEEGHCVPAIDALEASFEFAVAGIGRLLGNVNRVDVGRVEIDRSEERRVGKECRSR